MKRTIFYVRDSKRHYTADCLLDSSHGICRDCERPHTSSQTPAYTRARLRSPKALSGHARYSLGLTLTCLRLLLAFEPHACDYQEARLNASFKGCKSSSDVSNTFDQTDQVSLAYLREGTLRPLSHPTSVKRQMQRVLLPIP